MTPLLYFVTAICTINVQGDARCASLQVEGLQGLTCLEQMDEDTQWSAICDFDAGEKLQAPPIQSREFARVFIAGRQLDSCVIARTTLWCRR